MRLRIEMQVVEIRVQFYGNSKKNDINNSWCDNIQLFIDYGTEAEYLSGRFVGVLLGTSVQYFEGNFYTL